MITTHKILFEFGNNVPCRTIFLQTSEMMYAAKKHLQALTRKCFSNCAAIFLTTASLIILLPSHLLFIFPGAHPEIIEIRKAFRSFLIIRIQGNSVSRQHEFNADFYGILLETPLDPA